MQACNSPKKISSTTVLPKPVGVDPALGSLSYVDASTILEGSLSPVLAFATADGEPRTLVASMQRTKCYGKCPNYEAKVFSNGLVLFDGKAHSKRVGLHEAYLLEADIDSLLSQAEQLSYFDLSQNYPENGFVLLELPSTITYLKQGEKEHTIKNNHNAPKQLRVYERYFEELLETLEWKAVVEH